MKNSIYKIGAGILAGVAAGLYLNSESGKRFRRDVGMKFEDSKSQIGDKISKKAAEAGSYLQSKLNQVQGSVNNAFDMADEKINSTGEIIRDKEESMKEGFNAGVEQAKRNLKEHETTVKNAFKN